MSVLYITYDGILEPLGRSQVLSYLKPLASRHRIFLISYEKKSDWSNHTERLNVTREIKQSGLTWLPLPYHKAPTFLATLFDIVIGTFLALWLVYCHSISIVHARSYVPSLIALVLKRITGIKFLFDMRGFWADEKLESGWSSDGLLYHMAKACEKQFFLAADHVVSLTNAAIPIIQRLPYLQDRKLCITQIPTCADLSLFTPSCQRAHQVSLTIGYVGTAGNWYLFDKTAICFSELLRIRPDAKFLIVNRGEHEYIHKQLSIAGVPKGSVEIISASPHQMPFLISIMDASIFFIKPLFSKKASAATKLAELLGSGVPCLTNDGIGDMTEVLEHENVGIVINSFDRHSLVDGIHQLFSLLADPSINKRCVDAAQKHFSLDEGVAKYQYIYDQLAPS